MIPVLLRFVRDPAHRDALRSANGVNLGAEWATSVALVALPVVCLVAVLAILVTGCSAP